MNSYPYKSPVPEEGPQSPSPKRWLLSGAICGGLLSLTNLSWSKPYLIPVDILLLAALGAGVGYVAWKIMRPHL